jgi:hypothetical protein
MRGFRLVLSVSIIALMLGPITAVRGDDDEKIEFLTKPGEYSLYQGKLHIQVREVGGELQFDVTFLGSKKLWDEIGIQTEAAKANGWFVVAASPGEVWVYLGNENLRLLEYTLGGGAIQYTSSSGARLGTKEASVLLERAPKGLVDGLPQSFERKPRDR